MKRNENYKVDVLGAHGTCNSPIFKVMAHRGDITAQAINEILNSIVKITGYANCHVETKGKEFDVTYYNTDTGLFYTGSELFYESVTDYLDYTDTFKLVEIKTKKGTMYKAVPIITTNKTEEKTETTIIEDDIQF